MILNRPIHSTKLKSIIALFKKMKSSNRQGVNELVSRLLKSFWKSMRIFTYGDHILTFLFMMFEKTAEIRDARCNSKRPLDSTDSAQAQIII
jgi:hypothetical protein